MSALRFTSTYQAVNLLRNGHFDLVQSDGRPAVWEIAGAVESSLPEAVSSNNFAVLTDQDLSAGPERGLQLTLQSTNNIELLQSFLPDPNSQVFDFQVPLQPEKVASVQAGYIGEVSSLIEEEVYTFSWSYRGTQGGYVFTPVAYGLDGTELTLTPLEGQQLDRRAQSEGLWRRFSAIVQVPQPVSKMGLRTSRQADSDLATVDVSLFSFTLGAYSALPYLGDPLLECFPQGAIIMSMGGGCPPGFEELGNGDEQPLDEWVAADSDVQTRIGNFPRTSSGLTGTELHGSEVTKITPGTPDNVNFVSENSKTVVEDAGQTGAELDYAGTNPSVDAPGGNNGIPDHPHTFEQAATRPVSRGFRLCKRL